MGCICLFVFVFVCLCLLLVLVVEVEWGYVCLLMFNVGCSGRCRVGACVFVIVLVSM